VSDRFDRAVAEFDRLNGEDPTTVKVNGTPRPRALLHADNVAHWIARLSPKASEPLRLAARCQHLMRFRFPRSDFPEGRVGYLQWRKAAARFHAAEAEQVLKRVGYETQVISKVKRIILKQGMNLDLDVQTMEDALCLSFLQHDFAEFIESHPDEKVLHIVGTTWEKMSDQARAEAQALPGLLGGRAAELLRKVIGKQR
jgi:hypothetical protein